MARLLYLVNHAPFLVSHRLELVLAARAAGHDVHVAHGGGPDARAAAVFDRHGLSHTALPLARAGFSLREYRAAPAVLADLFAACRPDLVHAVALKMLLHAARAVGGSDPRAGRRPPALVGAATGLGYLYASRGFKRRALRAIYLDRLVRALARARAKAGSGAVRLIFQNEEDADALRRAGAFPDDPRDAAEAFRIIPGAGVDPARFAPPPPDGPEWEPGAVPAPGLAPADGRPVVALPARLLWDKGVGEFVAAARRLRAEAASGSVPVPRFVLAGGLDPDNPAAVPERTVRGWIAEGMVEWAGHVEDMAAFWRAAAVACLPSYREGCPKALLEAMAAGRPCVTTDAPGCRTAVADGVNGRLVPVRDARALARVLREAASDPASRRRWGAAGRRRAETEFALASVVARTLAVYGEALAGRRKFS